MGHKTLYCTLQVFNIRYPEMHKVQGAKCAISKLMYGLSRCTDDKHWLKLLAYCLIHTDEPYININTLLHSWIIISYTRTNYTLTYTYCTFQVFNIRYPEMHKVQGAKCAISKLMYGLSVCTDDNHSL